MLSGRLSLYKENVNHTTSDAYTDQFIEPVSRGKYEALLENSNNKSVWFGLGIVYMTVRHFIEEMTRCS